MSDITITNGDLEKTCLITGFICSILFVLANLINIQEMILVSFVSSFLFLILGLIFYKRSQNE